jgi:hypothetical protein
MGVCGSVGCSHTPTHTGPHLEGDFFQWIHGLVLSLKGGAGEAGRLRYSLSPQSR